MIAKNLSITKFQLFFLLIQSQIGIGLLSLPNVVQKTANSDGWISTILAGVVVQLMLLIYWLLLKRFPNDTYTVITKKILGRFLGKLLNLVIYFYFLMTGTIATVLFVKVIKLHLLPLTPGWVISLLILLACIYLTISDLRIIARFFVLAAFLILILLVLSISSLLIPKEIQFILPIGHSGIKNILLGSHNSLVSMLGFEGFLFLFPFLIHKKGALKTISMANIFITSFYTYFMFICLISFSPDQLKQIREPILYLFRGLSYRMVDRLDFLFLSIWIVPMTTSIIIYLFLASKSISEEKKSYRRFVVINGMLIFFLSLIPHTDDIMSLFSKYLSYLSYAIVFVIPAFLLILSFLFKKHEMGETT